MVTVRVSFEVFGKVQKVFFRKCTATEAQRLGVHGWCENTAKGTVRGEIEGEREVVDEMKQWLSKIGSPKSKIERCMFEKEESGDKKYLSFEIRQ
jgi:acylphosphatase